MAQLSPQSSAKFSSVCSAYNVAIKRDHQGQSVEMALGSGDLDGDGWVHDDTFTRIGWVAAYDALVNMRAEGAVRITDTRLSLFQKGSGSQMLARGEEVFAGRDNAVVRVRLFRMNPGADPNASQCIAEYTVQANFVDAEALGADSSAALQATQAEPARSRLNVDNEPQSLTAKEQAMEAKRRKIFDGACEVIGREGYAATTIRKVAKAAGVPISSMYQYIDTKEDLLFMITSTCMEEIFAYMTEELRRPGDAVTKMTHAIDAYMKYISKNRRYINLAYRETRALSRGNREKIFDIERRFTSLWEEIIINGNKADQFNAQKSRLAANMVYFFCNVWSLRYWSVQDYTEDEVRAYLMKFIMNGLVSEDAV